MKSDELYEHIWNNKGGDSLAFLANILSEKLNDDGVVSISSYLLRNANLDELLLSNCTALVSGFNVAEEFICDDWQHLEKYHVEKFKGRHAMVLVGYRNFEGKRRYLLQNWWKNKPYVEVDIDYMLRSGATIRFFEETDQETEKLSLLYPFHYSTSILFISSIT